MVEKSRVEKFLLALRMKISRLKSPGLKGLGLKLGVEKSGVEISFNQHDKKSQLFMSFQMFFKQSVIRYFLAVANLAYN